MLAANTAGEVQDNTLALLCTTKLLELPILELLRMLGTTHIRGVHQLQFTLHISLQVLLSADRAAIMLGKPLLVTELHVPNQNMANTLCESLYGGSHSTSKQQLSTILVLLRTSVIHDR